MAFNKMLDKEVRGWVIGDPEDRHLRVSVMQYNGGEMKLQIGPRVYRRANGAEGFAKAGRLTINEVKALVDITPEIEGVMAGHTIVMPAIR
jgi:hypothetical protein